MGWGGNNISEKLSFDSRLSYILRSNVQYLVRWKFGPNSLLNHMDHDTHWYQQFHPGKEGALKHYTSLLDNTMPSAKITAELFQLVQLVPGEPEPEDVVETKPEVVVETIDDRNKRIMKMYNSGKYTRREIATEIGLGYQTVYSIIRRLSDVK